MDASSISSLQVGLSAHSQVVHDLVPKATEKEGTFRGPFLSSMWDRMQERSESDFQRPPVAVWDYGEVALRRA